jgi:apolipoprotein N-acyltransferase
MAEPRRRVMALRWTAAVASGLLYCAAFPGFDAWPLGWMCLVPMLWALDDVTLGWRGAGGLGWAMGIAFCLPAASWLIGTLVRFGGLPLPLALLASLAFSVAQGTSFAAWAALVQVLRGRCGVELGLAAAVAMVAVEWLYPTVFPFHLSASQHRQTLVVQVLDLCGPLGLSFLLALGSGSLYGVTARTGPARRSDIRLAAVTLALAAADLGYGAWRVRRVDARIAQASRHLRIGIVQTGIGVYADATEAHAGLLRQQEQSVALIRQGAALILWPESSFSGVITPAMDNLKESVLGPIDKPLVFGGLRLTREGGSRVMFHSAFQTDGRGTLLATYDKHLRLVFGEYLPLGDVFPSLYAWSPYSAHFAPGTGGAVFELGGMKLAPTICYEGLWSGYVRDVMRADPDLLLNLTNDAWFGDTREPAMHLAFTTFRAVEHRRYLVRATNTGVSAIIDAAGRTIAATPPLVPATLLAEVPLLRGRTVYGRMGDWPGWLCLASIAFWLRGDLVRTVREWLPRAGLRRG